MTKVNKVLVQTRTSLSDENKETARYNIGAIGEAPENGKQYARKDGDWTIVDAPPSAMSSAGVSDIAWEELRDAISTGREFVIAVDGWGHATFHVHSDLSGQGQPNVYRLVADVGDKTLTYTCSSSDDGATVTWSNLIVNELGSTPIPITYGVTPWEELKAAYDSGRYVRLDSTTSGVQHVVYFAPAYGQHDTGNDPLADAVVFSNTYGNPNGQEQYAMNVLTIKKGSGNDSDEWSMVAKQIGGGSDNIVMLTYGTSTRAEALAAMSSGKQILIYFPETSTTAKCVTPAIGRDLLLNRLWFICIKTDNPSANTPYPVIFDFITLTGDTWSTEAKGLNDIATWSVQFDVTTYTEIQGFKFTNLPRFICQKNSQTRYPVVSVDYITSGFAIRAIKTDVDGNAVIWSTSINSSGKWTNLGETPIGGGGDADKIFIAKYGVTTKEQIGSAISEGKYIFVDIGDSTTTVLMPCVAGIKGSGGTERAVLVVHSPIEVNDDFVPAMFTFTITGSTWSVENKLLDPSALVVKPFVTTFEEVDTAVTNHRPMLFVSTRLNENNEPTYNEDYLFRVTSISATNDDNGNVTGYFLDIGDMWDMEEWCVSDNSEWERYDYSGVVWDVQKELRDYWTDGIYAKYNYNDNDMWVGGLGWNPWVPRFDYNDPEDTFNDIYWFLARYGSGVAIDCKVRIRESVVVGGATTHEYYMCDAYYVGALQSSIKFVCKKSLDETIVFTCSKSNNDGDLPAVWTKEVFKAEKKASLVSRTPTGSTAITYAANAEDEGNFVDLGVLPQSATSLTITVPTGFTTGSFRFMVNGSSFTSFSVVLPGGQQLHVLNDSIPDSYANGDDIVAVVSFGYVAVGVTNG